jgi:hypothetical protein
MPDTIQGIKAGAPDFPGIELLPVRPRVATAPVVERP